MIGQTVFLELFGLRTRRMVLRGFHLDGVLIGPVADVYGSADGNGAVR
jgi:hypothetical protein